MTEDECEVKLQQLLDHTAKRLLLAQREVVTAAVPDEETSNLVLVSKWGCDGSTGHPQFIHSVFCLTTGPKSPPK